VPCTRQSTWRNCSRSDEERRRGTDPVAARDRFEVKRTLTRSEFLRVAGAAGAVLLGGAYVVLSRPGQVSGSLAEVAQGLDPGPYYVGEFIVTLARDDLLSVTHRSDPDRVLWSSIPGESFVSAARGKETVSQRSAHFFIEDEVEGPHPDQTVDRIEKRGEALAVAGRLLGEGEDAGYTLTFSPVKGGRLRFEVEVKKPYNRVYLTYASAPDDLYSGDADLRGRCRMAQRHAASSSRVSVARAFPASLRRDRLDGSRSRTTRRRRAGRCCNPVVEVTSPPLPLCIPALVLEPDRDAVSREATEVLL
jgi:hypothetical protein